MSGIRQFEEKLVLPIVLDLFWRNGWQATSLSEIAKATGVQRGSLYNAYKGKDDLFLLAYEIYAERFISNVEKNMVGDSLSEALSGFFSSALANMTMGPDPKGCLTTKMLIEINLTTEPIQERLKSFMSDLNTLLNDKLSNPKYEVALRIPPNEAATLILTFIRGIAVMERIQKDPEQLMLICNSFIQVLTT